MEAREGEDLEPSAYSMFRCDTFEVSHAPAYKTQLNINGKSTLMEIDTGASLSVVSDKTFKALCQGSEKLSLHDTTITCARSQVI